VERIERHRFPAYSQNGKRKTGRPTKRWRGQFEDVAVGDGTDSLVPEVIVDDDIYL
jgi:hypothetical protein